MYFLSNNYIGKCVEKMCMKKKNKLIKLNIFMLSENNSTILSPILGQYGIKPLDSYKN